MDRFRIERDPVISERSVAIIITSVFLMWMLATAFTPLIPHVQVYREKGRTR